MTDFTLLIQSFYVGTTKLCPLLAKMSAHLIQHQAMWTVHQSYWPQRITLVMVLRRPKMVARLHITKGVGCRQCRKQGQVQYLRTYTTNLVHISLRRSEIFFVAFNLSFILWLHTTRTYFAGCTRDPSRALAATRLRLKNPNLKPTATITKSMARIIGPNAASFIAECSNWVRHYCLWILGTNLCVHIILDMVMLKSLLFALLV